MKLQNQKENEKDYGFQTKVRNRSRFFFLQLDIKPRSIHLLEKINYFSGVTKNTADITKI